MNGITKNFLVSDGLHFDNFKRVKNLEQVISLLSKKYDGKYPFVIDFIDNQKIIVDWADLKKRILEADLPVLFICKIEPDFWESDVLALAFKKISGTV
jgi:hypothetical protein